MQYDLIDYAPKPDQFWFKTKNMNAHKIYGVNRMASKDGGFVWTFPCAYPDGYLALKDFKALIDGRATPRALEKIKYLKSVPDMIKDNHIIGSLGLDFKRDPYPHQLEVSEAMLHYSRLAVLLEQGMGKTYCAHIFMEALQRLKERQIKVIVLAPVIVLGTWMRETRDFTSLRPFLYRGDMQQRLALREELMDRYEDWDVLVTNYETLIPPSQDFTKVGLLNWWMGLSEERKADQCWHWVRHGHMPQQTADAICTVQYRTVKGETKVMKKWEDRVYKALKKIPPGNLLTPELLRQQRSLDDLKFLQKLPADALILDEGSRIKGHKSKRSHAAMTLASPIKRRYVLSGTLCLGDPTDVYMPMTLIDNKIFGTDYNRFERQYAEYSPYNKHIITRYKNLDKLKARMDPYVISMNREDCLLLPDRIMDKRYYELSPAQLKMYDDIILNDTLEVNGQTIDVSLTIVKINKLMQVLSGHLILPLPRNDTKCNACEHVVHCVENDIMPWDARTCPKHDPDNPVPKPKKEFHELAHAKMDFLVEDLDLTAEKVIIWAFFKYDLQKIKETLDKHKIRYITADEPDCDYKFENDDTYKVFLGQISQGIGITLNSATCTIYYSHGQGLEPRLQSLDRNLRIGQTRKVWVKDYVVEGAVDETIVKLLNHKEDVKDFIQNKADCVICEKMDHCYAHGIEMYSEQCVLFGRRSNAEKRQMIKPKTLLDHDEEE